MVPDHALGRTERAEADQLRERESAAKWAAIAILVLAVGGLLVVGMAGELIADPGARYPYAIAALVLWGALAVALAITQLYWWWRARKTRRFLGRLIQRTELQLARERARRPLVRCGVAAGWLAVNFCGFGNATLFENAGRPDIAEVVLDAGGVACLFAALAAVVFLVLCARALIGAGFDALGRATEGWETEPQGAAESRRRRYGPWIVALICVFTGLLYALLLPVKFGIWMPPDRVWHSLLVLAAAATVVCAGIGWWYLHREDRDRLSD